MVMMTMRTEEKTGWSSTIVGVFGFERSGGLSSSQVRIQLGWLAWLG
jgi:hypothetical protein